ncbi:MAG: hypothetical protein M0Z37_04120, partial [Nitrospiraceae bacterium]|nr:hypothetical protein [Nitrospiraceae bacterium]
DLAHGLRAQRLGTADLSLCWAYPEGGAWYPVHRPDSSEDQCLGFFSDPFAGPLSEISFGCRVRWLWWE